MDKKVHEIAAGFYCVHLVTPYRGAEVIGDQVYVYRLEPSSVCTVYLSDTVQPHGVTPPGFVLYGSFKTFEHFLEDFYPQEGSGGVEFRFEHPLPDMSIQHFTRFFGYVMEHGDAITFHFVPVRVD